MSRIFVMVPTYNEASNIGRLIDSILKLKIDGLQIVVVDDFSPDRTWEIVEKMSRKNKGINLLLRKTKRGRGYAGREGFLYCLKHGADLIIEMDADFSHDPKFIPALIAASGKADVVLGSRYSRGGKDKRAFSRRVMSRLAGIYIKTVLGFRVKDPTSGFRCFTSSALRKIKPETLKAKDPFIVTEALFRAHRAGLRIAEVPIVFEDRKKGITKLSRKILMNNLINVWKLRRERWS